MRYISPSGFISSTTFQDVVFSMCKAAVAAYSRGWARDLDTGGITVNTIQPGPIDTNMNPANSDFAPVQKAAQRWAVMVNLTK